MLKELGETAMRGVDGLVSMGRNRVGGSTPSRRDPLLQLDDLEATLPLGLASWRDLDVAAGFHGLHELRGSMGNLLQNMGLETNTKHLPLLRSEGSPVGLPRVKDERGPASLRRL